MGKQAEKLVARTKEAGAEYVCVGLGVSTGAQAAEVARYADGVIVGSAFVRAIAEAPTFDDGVEESPSQGGRDCSRSGETSVIVTRASPALLLTGPSFTLVPFRFTSMRLRSS